MPLSITQTIQKTLPYKKSVLTTISDAVLGNTYDLSLVFVGDARMRTLNKKYREKDKTTDVLAFPLQDGVGELIINPYEAQRRAPSFSLSSEGYVYFLLIHGLLHLKGYSHGATMEKAERRLAERFSIR